MRPILFLLFVFFTATAGYAEDTSAPEAQRPSMKHAPVPELTKVDRLRNTAWECRSQADIKRALAEKTDDIAQKERLLKYAQTMEDFAQRSEEEADHEALFEQSPEVNDARIKEEEALNARDAAQRVVDKARDAVRETSGLAKENADAALNYMAMLQELQNAETVLSAAQDATADAESRALAAAKPPMEE